MSAICSRASSNVLLNNRAYTTPRLNTRFLCAADNVEGSSSDTQPIFAMSNDEGNSDDVKIPAVLLFSEQGRVLNNAMAAQEDASQRLTVRLAAKATGTAGMK